MQTKIAIIGLGYVGLPLAVEFAKKYSVTGFDINSKRISELTTGNDTTLETEKKELLNILKKENNCSNGLYVSNKLADISDANIYIITVPTPVDKNNKPNLTPLYKASETVGKVLKARDTVVYESTVYPGVTEDECVPVLERISGLKLNTDFYVGYSPERINPGDKEHTVSKIKKITSGSTVKAAKTINELYASIITAGTHLAPSIKVAEAAKVIENAQRDINIAFINELAKIFNKLSIDTHDVLEAAATKWNFLLFKPGLVGGHCIGVASYYLAQKAQDAGYYPEIILAGRRLNDGMGAYVAGEVIKQMVKKDIPVKNANILILGFAFKEDCPDVRNTRVIDIIRELSSYQARITVFDPVVNQQDVMKEYAIKTINTFEEVKKNVYDVIILAVSHKAFKDLDLEGLQNDKAVVYDVKACLDRNLADARL